MPETAAIPAMAWIIFNWLLWGGLILGCGLSFCRITRLHDYLEDGRSLFPVFFSGYAFLTLLLTIEHYFTALNYYATIAPAAIALFGFISSLKDLRTYYTKAYQFIHENRVVSFLLLLAVIAYAFYSILGPVIFDTGKYHLQTAKWYAESPIVYGLGNLCPFFAYNNANFLLAGIMEGTTLHESSFHVMNTLLVVAFFIDITATCSQLFRGQSPNRLSNTFAIIYAILMFAFLFGKSRSITPAITLDIASCYTMKLLIEITLNIDRNATRQLFTMLLPFCALLFTVKLSYAFQACLTVCAGLYFCCRNSDYSLKLLKRYLRWSILFFLVFFLPWFGRNIIMTGHLIFPMNSTRLDLQWSVPQKDAHQVYADVKTWGRGFDSGDPTDNAGRSKFLNRPDAWELPLFSLEWIRPWLKLVWYNLCIWAFSIVLLAVTLITRRRQISIAASLIILAPWFIGILTLFATAPTIRFMRASLFVFAAYSFALFICNLKPLERLFAKLNLFIPLLLIAAGLLYYHKGVVNKEYYQGAKVNGFETAPKPTISPERIMIDGIPFYDIQGSLWYAPLNSEAPASLRLIDKNNIKKGFRKQHD